MGTVGGKKEMKKVTKQVYDLSNDDLLSLKITLESLGQKQSLDKVEKELVRRKENGIIR